MQIIMIMNVNKYIGLLIVFAIMLGFSNEVRAQWDDDEGVIYPADLSSNLGLGTISPTNLLHIKTNDDTGNPLRIETPSGSLYFGEFEGEYGLKSNDEDSYLASFTPIVNRYAYASGILSIQDGKVKIGNGILNTHLLNVGGTVNATQYLINGQPFGGVDGISSLNNKIGIGTSSPNALLHVKTNHDAVELIKIESPGGSVVFGEYEGGLGLALDGDRFLAGYFPGSDMFNFGGQALFAKNGNVGIGTADLDTYKLAVNGTINAAQYLINGQPFGGVDGISSLNNKIGIGTDSPNALLHLKEAVDGNLIFKIEGPSGSLTFNDYEGEIGLGFNGNDQYLAGYVPGSDLYIYGNGSLYAKNGNIGIGTHEPGNYKLAVKGKIHTQEVAVDMVGWSDYVFDKDYDLLPLEEVKKHIEEKGHLPNVPSESEVLENGIELGAMNAKLLEKIEELTLYVIKLQEEVNELKKDKI